MTSLKDMFNGSAQIGLEAHSSPVAAHNSPVVTYGSYQINKVKLDLKNAQDKHSKRVGQRDLLIEQKTAAEAKVAAAQSQLGTFDLVQILLQKTSEYARKQTKGRLEELVSNALNVVYGGSHSFIMDLQTRAGRPEVDYWLQDGNTLTQLKKPDYNNGGGKVNVITIALRLGIDEIVGDNSTLWLDEIGPNVDGEAAVNLAYFLKQYGTTFNRQIVLITHNDALREVAEYSIAVSKKDGEAIVKGSGSLQLEGGVS